MAPLCNMGKNIDSVKSEKPDFSSIINFIGGDLRKDKKRRRGDAEKKRRDRINRCLDQLEELIPYVRQKKLCSKVDKAEVLELTVHFVKETLFEKELSYRKSHLSSLMEYERMKWSERDIGTYEKTRKVEKCNCGCGNPAPIEKRSRSAEPAGSPYRSIHVLPPPPPPVSIRCKDF
ncbi:transcription factor HES-2-like [Hydractinia symbiolongicarpus]|uniref:transcription factor HES-2-like n=1 Tax=Hydractinia symbiolongicarpus TaxID=13093 RepID=UPI00254FBB6C|nr:transcription factor HES-2-like [Hydractinia symbiolongicarpus]